MKRSRLVAVVLGLAVLIAIGAVVWWRATRKPPGDDGPQPVVEAPDPTAKGLLAATARENLEHTNSPAGFPAPTGLPAILKVIGGERAFVANFAFVRDGDRPGWEWRLIPRVPHKDASVLEKDVLAAFRAAGFTHDVIEKDAEFSADRVNRFRRTIGGAEEVVRTNRPANLVGGPDGASAFDLAWRVTSLRSAPAPTYEELTRAVPVLVPERRGPVPIPEKAQALFADQVVRRVSRLDTKRTGYTTTIEVYPDKSASLEERLRAVLLAEGFEARKSAPADPYQYLTKRATGFLAHCTLALSQKDGCLCVSVNVQTD